MRPGSSAFQLLENVALPTLPTVVERLNALMDDPNAGTREVGAVVAQDAPLASRVLRIANSAAYGLRERVLSAEQASAVLGMRELRTIALQASVIGQFAHLDAKEFDLNRLWKHNILTSRVCSSLARKAKGADGLRPEEYATCGLLHDLGQVVLLEHITDPFLEAVRRSQSESIPLHQAEEEILGFSHAEVGARIALRWNLPSLLVSAIQFHHGPMDEVECEPAVALVYLANLLGDRAAEGDREGAIAALVPDLAELLSLSEAHWERAVDDAIAAWPGIEV